MIKRDRVSNQERTGERIKEDRTNTRDVCYLIVNYHQLLLSLPSSPPAQRKLENRVRDREKIKERINEDCKGAHEVQILKYSTVIQEIFPV